MSGTTEETWKIAHAPTAASSGTLLNTLAYNISDLNGRRNIPPRRGENPIIPGMDGRLWVPKRPDQRTILLGMWVQAKDADGVLPSTEQARRAKLNDNIETLINLFGVYTVLLNIEQKIRLGSGLVTRTGQGECVNTLDFQWDEGERTFAKFVAEIVMPDPYWYESSTPKL